MYIYAQIYTLYINIFISSHKNNGLRDCKIKVEWVFRWSFFKFCFFFRFMT